MIESGGIDWTESLGGGEIGFDGIWWMEGFVNFAMGGERARGKGGRWVWKDDECNSKAGACHCCEETSMPKSSLTWHPSQR